MKPKPESLATSADVILTEMSDGTGLLLNMRTKFYYTLNRTGVFIWKTLEKSKDSGLDGLADAIHKHFDVNVDRARADLNPVLQEMVDEQLVVERTTSGI